MTDITLAKGSEAWYKYNTMKANGGNKKKKGGKDGEMSPDGEDQPQEFAVQLMSNVINYVSF